MDKQTYLKHMCRVPKGSNPPLTVNKVVNSKFVACRDYPRYSESPEDFSINSLLEAGVDPSKSSVKFEESPSLSQADQIFNACDTLVNEIQSESSESKESK